MRYAPLRLLPDFRPRTRIVRLPVGRVVVLVGIKILVRLLRVYFAGFQNRAVRGQARVGQNQMRAVCPQQLLALIVGIGRQAQMHLIAFGRADHGIRDSRIAAGCVQNDFTRPQFARSFALQNHVSRRPVFHRTAGIGPFGFGIHLHARIARLQVIQADQWRTAHQVGKVHAAFQQAMFCRRRGRCHSRLALASLQRMQRMF